MGDEAGAAAAAKADAPDTKIVVIDNALIGDLQGIETISDEELMGTDPEKDAAADKAAADKATADKTAEDAKALAEKKAADSGSKDADASGTDADKKAAKEAADKKAVDDKKVADDKAEEDKKITAGDKDAIAKRAVDDKKVADDTAAQKIIDDKKVADDAAAEAKKASDKDTKAPKGFVKIEALHEARETNKFLKNEIAKLKVQQYESQDPKAKAEPLVSKAEVEEFKDFKPFTDAEFEEKFEEDAKAGLQYLQRLNRFHDFQRRQTETKLTQKEQERELDAAADDLQKIYDTTESLMEDVLPGIFDDEVVKTELTAFAEEIGFSEDLFYLTNPETRIILPGESRPLVLGEQAADILKVLVTTRKKIASGKSDETDLTKLTADIEKKLRTSIEKELLAKFKKSGDDKDYTSIDDIPTSDNENQFKGKVLSESEFNKLTSQQQDAYLAGT